MNAVQLAVRWALVLRPPSDTAMFIAQTGLEPPGFQQIVESLNYTVEA